MPHPHRRLLFPVYDYKLYIRHATTTTVLLVAQYRGRKQQENNSKATSNHYSLHLPDETTSESGALVGRLQSNLFGTEFQIFTPPAGGVSSFPRGSSRTTSRRAIAVHHDEWQENGGILYTANLLGSRPRIMDVCIPHVVDTAEVGAKWRAYAEGCQGNDESSSLMLSCLRQMLADSVTDQQLDESNNNDFGLVAFQNRPPWWNADLGSFVLNFGGRVSVASVKNFQLCERENHDSVKLQFGRIQGRHSFTMDFQYPLSAVQAFSIAISSLQSKISFG